jgi:hypothetical protein
MQAGKQIGNGKSRRLASSYLRGSRTDRNDKTKAGRPRSRTELYGLLGVLRTIYGYNSILRVSFALYGFFWVLSLPLLLPPTAPSFARTLALLILSP